MSLPDAPRAHGTLLDAQLHLLDRQLLNAQGDPVGIVDDLSIDGIETDTDIPVGAAAPRVNGIVTGHVMITRILGGDQPRTHLQTVPWRLVAKIGPTVQLADHDETIDTQWAEKWLADNIIGRIPGGHHAAE